MAEKCPECGKQIEWMYQDEDFDYDTGFTILKCHAARVLVGKCACGLQMSGPAAAAKRSDAIVSAIIAAWRTEREAWQAEKKCLTDKIAAHEEQLCRIAKYLGQDARQARDGTIAGLVIEEIKKLRDLLAQCDKAMDEAATCLFSRSEELKTILDLRLDIKEATRQET